MQYVGTVHSSTTFFLRSHIKGALAPPHSHSTDAVLEVNTVYYAVAVFDMATQSLTTYVNGVVRKQTSGTVTSFSANTNTDNALYFGADPRLSPSGPNPQDYTKNCSLQVDEVALYSRSLSPAEVDARYRAAHYGASLAAPCEFSMLFSFHLYLHAFAPTTPFPPPCATSVLDFF